MGPDPLELPISENRALCGEGGQVPKDGEGVTMTEH